MNVNFLTIFIILVLLPASGESVLTKFDPINLSISCKVDIAPLQIKSVNEYDIVKSLDCYQSTEIGKPALPVRSFFVLLPPNTTIKDITITQINQIKIDGKYNIKPVLPPIPISNGFKNIPAISQFEEIYPENILYVNSIQKLRGYIIACISIFAACYNPKTKQLTWNKQIDFNLKLTTPKTKSISPIIRRMKEDEELVKRIVVNPNLVNTYVSPVKEQTTPYPTYNYVIITNESLSPAFGRLCELKPMSTIVTTSWIYNNYSGKDEQEKIKAFIKDYYEKYGTRYVLLGGDIDVIPYRGVYAKVPKGSNLGDYVDFNIPCDLYYACLDGDLDWDTDNDGIYGELGDDKIDLMPEIYIGRAPVSNLLEATDFVNKVITYCENTQNNYSGLLIAYKLWHNPICDSKEIMEEIVNHIPVTYTIYREYETGGGISPSRILNYINAGVRLIVHANHSEWYTAPPFSFNHPINVKTLNNGSKTFIFNTIGCTAGDFSEKDCIGEEMILNSNGGAIAFIGNSRYGWFDETDVKLYSGEYQIEFFKKLFKEGYTRIGEALGKSKMVFIPKCNEHHNPYRWIMFCLNLLGDPTIELQAAEEIFCIDHTIMETTDKPETLNLIVTLKNLKEGTITEVSGKLSTTDKYIIITKDNAIFGTLSSQKITTNFNDPYQINVKPNCPPIHKVKFNLEITGKEGEKSYTYIDRLSVTINLKVDDLSKVIHYPNPCYPDEGEVLKIANIPLNSNPKVYIYNLAGELIRTLDEEGVEIRRYPKSKTAYWNAKNDAGEDVAFGIYIYLLKCDVGTKKGKIAIIR